MSITKDITTLALTKMHGGVCTAGIDADGRWVRPVRAHVESHNPSKPPREGITDYSLLPLDFFHGGQSHLVNLGVTRFWFTEATPHAPHVEDWTLDLKQKPQLLSKLSDEEQALFLASHAESDLAPLTRDHRRSLMLVRPDSFSFSFGKNQSGEDVSVRASFVCRSERIVEFNLNHNPHYGALQLHTQKRVMLWIDELAGQELLQVTAEEYPRLLLTPKGREALDGSSLLALSGFARAQQKTEPKIEENEVVESPAPAIAGDRQLVERLKQWRREKASSLSLPAYVILHDSVIETIAAELPRRLEELGRVKGIGPAKLAQFGDQIIAIIDGVVPMSLPVPAAPKPAISPVPVSQKPLGWRVQVEMWRQGGDAPDAQLLMAVLGDWQTCAHGDLIVAINALKDLGARAAAGNLLVLLRETSNGQLMGTICEALGHFGSAEAVGDLMAMLDDERPGVRRAAARALGRLRARQALAKIEHLSQADSSDSVRLSAEAAKLLIKGTTNQ